MDQYDLAAVGERDGLWDWDLTSNRVHFSPRWVSMVGCEEREVGNSPDEWFERIHPDDRLRVRRDLDAQMASSASSFGIDHRMRHKDGTYRWTTCRGVVVRNGRGVPVRLAGAHADVTADQVADSLTGLPNRLLFADRLVRAVERAGRDPEFVFAVLLVEPDQPAADAGVAATVSHQLLTAAARRLETCLRADDHAPLPAGDYFLARLRGTQFAVLLNGLTRLGDAQAVAERVLAALRLPVKLCGRQAFPRVNVGIALSATGYTRAEDVLRDADAALYRARSLGGDRSEVFDIDLLQSADARSELEAELEEALERQQFVLFYQPVVETASNRIVGFEALARWRHPTRGMVQPQEFIPIAERTGFIVSLGEWTLREACRQLKAWQSSLRETDDVWVSVNVSSEQFKKPGFVARVSEALREAELEPGCLMLELTESMVVEDPATVRTLLMQLRIMGVRIGIDDFGTGHSSFSYLHQFPADFLKVDQSFIDGMEVRQDKAEIVGALAGLAEQLGLRVIAEGVENDAGLGAIRSRRCEYLQGFIFSRPVDPEAAADLLRASLAGRGGPQLPEASQAVPEPTPGADVQSPPRRKTLSGWRAYLYTALATVAALAAAGLARTALRGSSAPQEPPATSAAPSPTIVEVDPEVTKVPSLKARAAGSGAPDPTASTPAARNSKPRAAQLATVALAVEHQHVFGGCRGVLRVAPSGVSFTTDNSNDAFVLKYGQIQSGLSNDTLTIRSDRKTYRFKAADSPGKGERSPQLKQLMEAIKAREKK